MKPETELQPLSSEFLTIDLGDARRENRARVIADSMAGEPAAGLPTQAGGDAALEATYRFFDNDAVQAEDVMAGHVRSTAARAARESVVLVIHDTTAFSFRGEGMREGLGRMTTAGSTGFHSHMSISSSMEGKPLGTLAMYAWAWTGTPKNKRPRKERDLDTDRDSDRWLGGVEASREALGIGTKVIHVMDREGDQIELLVNMVDAGEQFVVRVTYDRRLSPGRNTSDVPKLYETLQSLPVQMTLEVPVTPRRDDAGKGGRLKGMPLEQGMRTALLEVKAGTFPICPSNSSQAHLPRAVVMNFVEIREVNPPEGQDPILWRLVTTEPIDTEENVASIINIYRRRWLIEEFFKAIKTGCGYQELQLESGKRLIVALSIIVAVAWRLLLLRWMERNRPDSPAELVLTPTQLAALTAVQTQKKRPLPAAPTVRQILLVIAALGGHIKNNGAPGWLVLGKGYQKLQLLEEGWVAARAPTS